jgi:UDP-glucose 4-epimerase
LASLIDRMRTLITGGAGFIGSHVVEALLDDGHEVVVVDDLSTGRRENLDGALRRGASFHEGDVTDVSGMHALLSEARPEAVVHLAAQIGVRHSVEDPGHDALINVGGTVSLLEAARAAGARRFVFASTGGGLYGEATTLPTPEDAPIAPLAPYGTSKAAAETYVTLYERLHGLSTVSLRMANVYGPRQDPVGEGGVVAIFCAAAREGRAVTVYGDGRQTRDLVYVGDAAAAFAIAVRSDAGGAFNVGTGEETSVLELAARLELETQSAPGRIGEVRRSCLDPSLAAEGLGWRPATSLADGLARTLDWVAAAA